MTFQELREVLDNGKFYIFGTGFVSEMLWSGLELKGSEKNVIGFLVSDPKQKKTFHGRPVLKFSQTDSDKNTVIIAAVHETVYRELEFGYRNAIWIYPFLYEYLYGPPLEERTVKLDEIRRMQHYDQYWIAVRYAAVKGIETSDEYLKGLYLKALSLHASEDTAVKRLCNFAEILADVNEKGFDPLKTIDITDRFEVIDGLHRLALAAHCGAEKISCRIYRHSDIYDKVLGPANKLPEKILRDNSFTEDDIAVLKEFKEICG